MKPWLLVLALACFIVDPLAHLTGGDSVCTLQLVALGLVAAFLALLLVGDRGGDTPVRDPHRFDREGE